MQLYISGHHFTDEHFHPQHFRDGMRVRANRIVTDDGELPNPDSEKPGDPGFITARPGELGHIRVCDPYGNNDVVFDSGRRTTISPDELDFLCEVEVRDGHLEVRPVIEDIGSADDVPWPGAPSQQAHLEASETWYVPPPPRAWPDDEE